ncbi:MAG: DUF5053 domain-containing protein [Polaribacter sp.]
MKTLQKKQTMKAVVWDIIVDIKWASISKNYFGKSRSWLSQKMNGFDGNGSETEFSKDETETLKNALYDLSNRIKKCADKLDAQS